MGVNSVIIRREDRPLGHIAPSIAPEEGELCYDTRLHQGTPPRSDRRDREQREEEEAPWLPERQPPRPAPFLRERRDNDFGGRLARRPRLHDARESAIVGGAVADPAQGHTAFLTVPSGGRVTLVPPVLASVSVPEPEWDVDVVDDAGGHVLRERPPQPLVADGAVTTGMTLVVTVTGATGTIAFDGPVALPSGDTEAMVSGGGQSDVFAAIWHPSAKKYLILPGPMGFVT